MELGWVGKKNSTTTKSTVPITPIAGFNVTGNVYRVNDYIQFDVIVTKSDSSAFPTGNHIQLFTIPYNVGTNKTLSAVGDISGWRNAPCNSFASSAAVYGSVAQAGCTKIYIGGGFYI